MKRFHALLTAVACVHLLPLFGIGQPSNPSDWERASHFWEHNKLSAAQHHYDEWRVHNNEAPASQLALAEYRATSCAIQLQHQDAEQRVERFLKRYPEHPLGRQAQWDFANFLYRKKDWKDAAAAFDGLSTLRMKPAQKLEWQFKRGHAYFELEEYEEARLDLFAVMEAEDALTKFREPARYYFSHISYIKGQPQVALEGFQSLADDPALKNVVPIYIAQLLHETEQYDRLIDYAPVVFSDEIKMKDSQRADISRLVGDALYRMQDFLSALPYLEEAYHEARGSGRTRDFSYQMGYTYYQAESYLKALTCFALVVRDTDDMAQLAHYHAAACYLALDEKSKAKTSFKKASELGFDSDVQEDALFSYAKLAYELTFNPFDDAVVAIERYLAEYPNSRRNDEAYGFLLEVYMSSKNYERALAALEQIGTKTPEVKKAYQLVSYNRGVELFRAAAYEESHAYFESARTYPYDPILAAESHFWQGEASYLQENYVAATAHYAAFESAPGAFKSVHYANGMYARGYALFKRGLYLDALSAFRGYLKSTEDKESGNHADAKLRVADCYFVNKEFNPAARYYGEVIASSEKDEAYARFQRAECFASLNQPESQIAELSALIATQTPTSYLPEALYSIARAEIESDQLAAALDHLNRLRTEFPEALKSKNALVDLCLIAMKTNQPEEVLRLWDIIRTQYGSDGIASDAYNIVEPVLIDQGLLGDLPAGVGLNTDEIEERLFNAAREAALERNCDKAVMRLSEYINDYNRGAFWVEAHFFLGNCAYDQASFDAARQAFETVLAEPVNDYTEPAALGAATIAWNSQDLAGAKMHYKTLESVSFLQENVLEARIGLMRCHYLLDEAEKALSYADQVISNANTPTDIQRTAQYWRAKINYDAELYDTARPDLQAVSALGGTRGAECQFLLCEMEFIAGNYAETESALFAFISAFANYSNWKHRAFLLLIDTYIALEDWFQARATAESILEFVENEDIRKEAKRKLLEIDRLELAELNPSASTSAQDSLSSTPEITE